jgi:hypothetical protein
MIKKIIALGVLIIMAISLGACANKYNAVIYDNVGTLANEEFLKDNLTQGAYYEDEYLDDSYPKSINYVIKNQEKFEKTFVDFPTGIDFEKEMLLVYFFTCASMVRPYEISKINIDSQILKIDIKSVPPKQGAVGDATKPKQRCIAVKMDKLYITSAEFVVK